MRSWEEDLRRKVLQKQLCGGVKRAGRKYPTGLHTDGLLIAMPHTDSAHVNEACISIARLENPIPFHEMGNKKIHWTLKWSLCWH